MTHTESRGFGNGLGSIGMAIQYLSELSFFFDNNYGVLPIPRSDHEVFPSTISTTQPLHMRTSI